MSQPLNNSGDRRSTIRFGHDEGRRDEEFYPASPVASFSTNNEQPEDPVPGLSRYQLQDNSRETDGYRRSYAQPDNFEPPRNPPPAAFNPSFHVSDPHRNSSPARHATWGTDPFDLSSPLSPPQPGLSRTARVTPPAYRGAEPSFAYPSSQPRKTSQDTLYDDSPFNSKTGAKAASSPTDPPAPLDNNGQPLKPALRRSSTEEHLRHLAARQAINLVESHTRDFEPRRRGQYSSARSEDEELGLPRGEHERAAGVLSNLLKLYGNHQQAAGLRRSASCQTSSSWDGEKSEDERGRHPDQLRRTQSDASVATTFYDDEMVDPFDPRMKTKTKSAAEPTAPELSKRRSYSDDGAVEEKIKSRKPSRRESKVYNAMRGKKGAKEGKSSKDRELRITAQVAGSSCNLSAAALTADSERHRHPAAPKLHPQAC